MATVVILARTSAMTCSALKRRPSLPRILRAYVRSRAGESSTTCADGTT